MVCMSALNLISEHDTLIEMIKAITVTCLHSKQVVSSVKAEHDIAE